MTDQQVRVTFEPHGKAVYVLPGTKVLEAAGRVGLTIDTPCGGAGTCGKCRVQVTRGACEPTAADRKIFDTEQIEAGWRLACQTGICGEAVVYVPPGSRFADQHQILTRTEGKAAEILPAVRKVPLQLDAPTLADPEPDLMRLGAKLGAIKSDLSLLRELPARLREWQWRGTAVLTDHHLIDLEPGDTSAQCYGAAFDIGTTTLVGALLDLRTGEELAVASTVNPQTRYGDDVLSRIKHAGSSRGLKDLRAGVVGTVNKLIDEMCAEAAVPRERIYEVTIAGNTTMQHLLCGLDVRPLGQVPFSPTCGRGLMLRASELEIAIHPRGAAYVFPVIGGFVGGDTVGCILATRLTEQKGPALLVDIGTNGEIVLSHAGAMHAASTAAGPAFEGARISCGMRATRGAIEKVVFDGDVRCSVIGAAEPIGLCGSGLVDAVAELLRAGVVSSEGRMLPPKELPETVSASLRERVREGRNGQTEFVLARRSDGGVVTLTQRDIRELQLAAGAIRAGIAILLRQAGLSTGDLDCVLIAGGFGSFIRRSNAQRIGLLPTDIARERIHYVGNASLNGAKWALLSTNMRRQAEQLARDARHVELSQDANFQMEFAEAMIFPER